jgi:hypothetical protein
LYWVGFCTRRARLDGRAGVAPRWSTHAANNALQATRETGAPERQRWGVMSKRRIAGLICIAQDSASLTRKTDVEIHSEEILFFVRVLWGLLPERPVPRHAELPAGREDVDTGY